MARQCDGRAPEVHLNQDAHDRRAPSAAEHSTSLSDTGQRKLVPSPDAVSQAIAVLRDRLLHELGRAEVRAAEIRLTVQKHGHRSYPRLDLSSRPGAVGGELALELRRLIAWSGGTIADVAEALETHGLDLDESARELLRDEVEALEIDLALLNVRLAEPVDWDREFERMLGGEIAPFDDPAGDEDDENDD